MSNSVVRLKSYPCDCITQHMPSSIIERNIKVAGRNGTSLTIGGSRVAVMLALIIVDENGQLTDRRVVGTAEDLALVARDWVK